MQAPYIVRLTGIIAQFVVIVALVNGRVLVSQSMEAASNLQKADRETVRLPLSRFPQLPSSVRNELNRRGCTVPQVWGARKPGNVITGSFVQAGQTDWAVLCSVNRISSILIFPRSSADQVIEIGSEPDVNKLQGMGGDQIGYSRSISPVGRDFIMRHYQAYGGVKPPPIDHLGIDDAFVEKGSKVHYFHSGKWIELTGAD